VSGMQRTKGAIGERELAALIREHTGWDVRRRVRQHDGDSDLEGVPGWCVEVKRHKTALPGDIAQWWAQAYRQADDCGGIPVLFYRADRREWRAVWPLVVVLTQQQRDMWQGVEWTADTTVQAWAAVARDVQG
jgi:Holliday junction resolvase